MENKQKPRRRGTLAGLVVVMLFFLGIALITAALWLLHPAPGLGFLGLATLYTAACISRVSNRKDGKR